MATTATPTPHYSIDSSMSRSRRDWMASDSDAIHDDPAPSDDPFFTPPTGKDTSVWKKPSSNSSAEVGPVMGADSWPALSSSNKSPSLESPKGSSLSMQAGGTPPLSSTTKLNANANTATSSENHNVNGQRKPSRRNTTPSSSSSNISNPPNANVAPLNPRDQNHSQRGGGSHATHQVRSSHRNRNNTNSYPRGDHGHRRNFDQTGYPHRNYNGRDMHLQPQRGFGMMRPQILVGPPSFPASSAQYMAAPQLGSYGGPMLYPDHSQPIFLPPPPPESVAFVGHFPPPPMYFPTPDAILYNKILTQVEYYFSADNLSTDKHLREQMNDEGWVPVRVIAGFRRLAEMTNNIQTILEALRSSQVVETKGEAIRRRGDWDKYLLPRELTRPGPASGNASSLGSQLGRMTLSESRE